MQCSTSVGSSVWDLSIDEVQNWMFEQCMGCWLLASEKQMVYKWQMNELKSKRLPLASISKYAWFKNAKKKCDPRRIIFQGPKLWTLHRSRKKKTGPSKTAPPNPRIRLENKRWVSPVSHGCFYSKIADLRYNTWQYTVDRSQDMIFTNHIYIIYYTYLYIHSITLHYIALHSIPFLIGGFNHLEKYEFVTWDYDIPNMAVCQNLVPL